MVDFSPILLYTEDIINIVNVRHFISDFVDNTDISGRNVNFFIGNFTICTFASLASAFSSMTSLCPQFDRLDNYMDNFYRDKGLARAIK